MRVGLTGGIASGKSTASALLRQWGAIVIDGDALAREVVEKGTPGLAAVVAAFGPDVLNEDGDLDRPKMAKLVFGDDEARRRLEAIVHPLVFERIVEIEVAAGPDAVVVHDIPLLAETGRHASFDAVIVIDAPEEVQLERMTRDRAWSEGDARARMSAQASRELRRSIATHVVDNSGTCDELAARLRKVYDELLSR